MTVDLEKLRALQQEVTTLRERGLLDATRFDAILEKAAVLCQQAPRMLEGLIKLAPSDWINSHLSASAPQPPKLVGAAKSKKVTTPSPN